MKGHGFKSIHLFILIFHEHMYVHRHLQIHVLSCQFIQNNSKMYSASVAVLLCHEDIKVEEVKPYPSVIQFIILSISSILHCEIHKIFSLVGDWNCISKKNTSKHLIGASIAFHCQQIVND